MAKVNAGILIHSSYIDLELLLTQQNLSVPRVCVVALEYYMPYAFNLC